MYGAQKRNHPVLHRLRTFPEGGSFEEFISRWFPRGLFAADALAERLHAVFGKAGPSLSGLHLLFRRMAGIKGIEEAPSGPGHLRWRTAKACYHAALPVLGLLDGPCILDLCSSVGHFHPLIRLAHPEARIISCDKLLITQMVARRFFRPDENVLYLALDANQNLPFLDDAISSLFSCDSLCYLESLEKCLCELSRVLPPDGQAVFPMCMPPAHPNASQPTTRARSKEMWEQLCSILDGDEEALFVDQKELTRMALQAVQLSDDTFSEKGALVESYTYIRKPSPQRLGWSCPENGEASWSINPIYNVKKRGSTLLLRKRLKPRATPDLEFDSFPDHLELPATRFDERVAWAQQAQILQPITARVYTPDRYWPCSPPASQIPSDSRT